MSRCNLNLVNSRAVGECLIVFGLLFSQSVQTFGCGPDFPNQLLDRGDDAVLAAPIASFDRELKRMQLEPSDFEAVLTTNDYAIEAVEADLADLHSALRKTKLSEAEQEEIIFNYGTQRSNLLSSSVDIDTNQAEPSEPGGIGVVPTGLPDEFTDYFLGCNAWRTDRTNEARTAWTRLLERTPKERHYHSTWAAYMLGRSWQGEDPDKAIQYFQQVRSLEKAGFIDRLGLAAASLGWEAQEELHQKHFDRAIELYLQQFNSGDPTARISLRFAAAAALRGTDEQLIDLATNAECRRVVTALLISYRSLESFYDDDSEKVSDTEPQVMARWLDAVEAAKVTDVESAEQLALAAYQSGHLDIAERWILRATPTPVTQWLQAKLLLYTGRVDDAAALLEKVARYFPEDEGATNRPPPNELKDNLYMPGFTYVSSDIYPADQTLAEVGVLRLARREYAESLDALLRSGFWMDAAYVAERVLTLDELKSYVDRNWPAVESTNVTATAEQERLPLQPLDIRREIRYLLARRLTRMERANEAFEYFPPEQQTNFQTLVEKLSIDGNGESSANDRADALFAAARMMHAHGMELIGTEVEPDWHINQGDFEDGISVASRATNAPNTFLVASQDELQRATEHTVVPDLRFHYRYEAASLAWKAAGLMPNNTDQTARVLCIGGTWIKVRQPEMADVFYKSLVRRCRKTDIGRLADRMRWFPDLDENGNPVPWTPDPPQEVELDANTSDNSSAPGPGYCYVLNRGNTLQDVADIVRASHQLSITTEEIQSANPAANSNRLKAGQKIFVPAPPSVPPDTTNP